MTQTEYAYTVPTNKTVAQAIADLEQSLANRSFTALWHLDVNEKLREKGLDLEPVFHIFEVCNAPTAKVALETNLQIGYFLPCKIVVYAEAGQTRLGLLRPTLLMQLLGEEQLQDVAHRVEDELRGALDAAAV